MSAALRAHRRFDVLLAVLFLLHFILLFTTCSLAVGSFSDSLTTGSVSDPLQRLFVVVYCFLDASPAPPTPLLSIAPFVIVGSR